MMREKREQAVATYRVQLGKDFTFADCAAIADYLQQLGISHIYLSPVTEAVSGSNHGYDVLDFNRVSTERGGEEGLRALDKTLAAMDPPLKLIIDIVPNHMAASEDNPYWCDLLHNGDMSSYRGLFDIRIKKGEAIDLPVLETGAEPVSCGHYRKVAWDKSLEDMSYRRFFTINGLVGLRVEEAKNFSLVHKKIFSLNKELQQFAGVRVDHIDGLVDPCVYLERLAHQIPHIWVEKILARDEHVPENWPVCGTTGYEFIDRMNGLFVRSKDFRAIEDWWHENIQNQWCDFQDCVIQSKIEIIEALFQPELKRLVSFTAKNAKERREAKLFWLALTSCFPAYRTYKGEHLYSEQDRHHVSVAHERAIALYGEKYKKAALRLLPLLLFPRADKHIQAVKEWQQLASAVTAKGLEDTAHYRYTPLAALNDVGCEADLGGGFSDEASMLRWINARAQHTPGSLNATSTHDTKRSEDTRHRLYALADDPKGWIAYCKNVFRISADLQQNVDGRKVPGPACQYFLLQALLGIWPFDHQPDADFTGRLKDYMVKAARESRLGTSWYDIDEDYETTLCDFVDSLLELDEFVAVTKAFAVPIIRGGAFKSLAVQALKILLPGVPDFYQGSELWNFALVDPDNRRAVDFESRKNLLARIRKQAVATNRETFLENLMAEWQNGAIKLWLIQKLLHFRRTCFLPWPEDLEIDFLKGKGKGADRFLACSIIAADERRFILIVPRYTDIDDGGIGALRLPEQLVSEVTFPLPEGFRNAGLFDVLRDEKADLAPGLTLDRKGFPVRLLAIV